MGGAGFTEVPFGRRSPRAALATEGGSLGGLPFVGGSSPLEVSRSDAFSPFALPANPLLQYHSLRDSWRGLPHPPGIAPFWAKAGSGGAG